ncbi:MAG: carboxypeptidase regulatory-like domain-containing protein, partial [Acidobacteriota bacterium]
SILVGIPFGAVYYSAFTDGNGNYALTDIPVGNLTIYVGGDGFDAQQATVAIVAGQTKTQDFALIPTGTTTSGAIAGTVTSTAANNPPISGVTIAVAGTNISTASAADGSYSLSNVPGGAQTLNVSKTGFQSASVQVTVTGGQTVTQNISLTPTPGTGTVTGIIRNAANAAVIVGATITVAGTNLSATSVAGGVYTINNVPSGAQTLNATATGFIAAQVPATVTTGQTLTQNISLSPALPPGEIRITLNWSRNSAGHPRDLDAHLTGPNPNGSCFHVFYNGTGDLNAAPFAKLEVDNRDVPTEPPTETIRISKLSPGIYRFYVYDFIEEDADGLSRSRATVQVFGSSGQLGSFTVPIGAGRYWTVFEINGQTGAITTVNQLAIPSSSCQ